MGSVERLCPYFPTASLLLSLQRHIEAEVEVGSFLFRYASPMSNPYGHSQHNHCQDAVWITLPIPDSTLIHSYFTKAPPPLGLQP